MNACDSQQNDILIDDIGLINDYDERRPKLNKFYF